MNLFSYHRFILGCNLWISIVYIFSSTIAIGGLSINETSTGDSFDDFVPSILLQSVKNTPHASRAMMFQRNL